MSFLVVPNLKLVVVSRPDPAPLLALPGAKPLPMAGAVGIPHTVKNSQVLRQMGEAVSSPIGYDYDWPLAMGKHTVADHQKEVAAFSTLYHRSYDLSEIGTRKTVSHLYASDYMQKTGDVRRVLIIAPLSTLQRVWADTIFFTLRGRSAVVLHGTAARRRKLFAENHDYYIINHDGIDIITERKYDIKKRLQSARLYRDDIDLVIVDEGAEFRNYGTEKRAVLKNLIRPEHAVWWLGGTPTPQAPTDAWAQANIVTPHTVPKYWTAFRDLTMKQITQYRWIPRPEATRIVYEALQPSIRYERNQVIPVDDPVYSERECELTPEQAKHFKRLKNEFVTMFDSGQIVTAANEAVLRTKLIQAACGVIYDRDGNTVVLDSTPRINALKEIIRSCNEKVIVFVPFTHVLHHVSEALSKEFTTAEVWGGVSKTKRDDIFMRFQQQHDPRVLVADAGTMSHGLTLTEASTIVWYAPKDSNNIYTQANGRITRDGQVNVPNIIHLSATAAERKAYQRLKDNGTMQGLLLEMVTAT